MRKDFFLDLTLPYFAVRGEQLEIKVVLYNYSPETAVVSLDGGGGKPGWGGSLWHRDPNPITLTSKG